MEKDFNTKFKVQMRRMEGLEDAEADAKKEKDKFESQVKKLIHQLEEAGMEPAL